MTTSSTTSSGSTTPSGTTKLVSEKFALLAKVGHHKKKLSVLHDETEYYSGIVSELLALVRDMSTAMGALPEGTMNPEKELSFKLRQNQLAKSLLATYPTDTELAEIRYDLLTSDGLENVVTITEDGYLTRSPDMILDIVGMSLKATKAELLSH